MSDSESDLRRARALGDRTRRTIFEALRTAAGPVDVVALTALAGTHHTAVRQHLAKLIDAGLVVAEQSAPHGRGRPRIVYRAVTHALEGAPYRSLASLLATAVGTGAGPRETGRAAGRAIAATARHDDPVQALSGWAAEHGFEPDVRSRRGMRTTIVLRSCPFADVAVEAPGVVCDLHLGLAEGVAESVGGIEVRGLHPGDPRKAGCRLELERCTGAGTDPLIPPT